MSLIVYFSSVSNTTHRFVERLALPAVRIPIRPTDPPLEVTEPFVLIVPTYGGGSTRGAVPKQVVRFLNNERNRDLLAAVIAAGNTNFGTAYCSAGPIVAAKCAVPYLYGFELLGTPDDVERVRQGLKEFWAARDA